MEVLLTYVSAPRLNDNGTPAARLLLRLCHALPCLLVRVVRGTHSDLILYAPQAIQVDVAIAAKERQCRGCSHCCTQPRLC